MAYVAGQQEDENSGQSAQTFGPSIDAFTNTATGTTTGNTASATKNGNASSSAPYVNVQDYLAVNQDAAKPLTDSLKSEADSTIDTAKATIDSSYNTAMEPANTVNSTITSANNTDIDTAVNNAADGDTNAFSSLSSLFNAPIPTSTPTLSATDATPTLANTYGDSSAFKSYALGKTGYQSNPLDSALMGSDLEKFRKTENDAFGGISTYLSGKNAELQTAYGAIPGALQTAQGAIRRKLTDKQGVARDSLGNEARRLSGTPSSHTVGANEQMIDVKTGQKYGPGTVATYTPQTYTETSVDSTDGNRYRDVYNSIAGLLGNSTINKSSGVQNPAGVTYSNGQPQNEVRNIVRPNRSYSTTPGRGR